MTHDANPPNAAMPRGLGGSGPWMQRTRHNSAVEHSFDLAIDPDVVLSELISEEFLLAFAEEVGVEVDDLIVGTSGDDAAAKMLWQFSTDKDGIPSLAKKMLPGEVRLSWAQSWGTLTDGVAAGTLEVNLLGNPKAVSNGTATLTVAGDGCTLATSTTTKASLPFPIAGKVQSMIDKDLVGWILSVQARVLTRRHPS